MGKFSKNNKSQRGDTLVEVAIAMAVLGLVLASTLTVINRSLYGVMNAVERTAARGEVNSQVEMLRYVFDTQTGINRQVANDIIDMTKNSTDSGMSNIASRGCAVGSGGFYLGMSNDATEPISVTKYDATDSVADNVAAAPHPGDGIWVEGVKHGPSGSVPGYIDFYVRACWTPRIAQEIGQGRLESTIRVYYREDG